MDNYITTSEIARNLKISKVTLWKLRKENKTFPKAIICGKRKMIFNEQEILSWFKTYKLDKQNAMSIS